MQTADRPHDHDRAVPRRPIAATLLVWLAAFALVVLVFYAMDHAVMSAQGLPLNMNLTPAQ